MRALVTFALLLFAAGAQAQTLSWEHVGSQAIDISSQPSIAPDGTMWGRGSGSHGLSRLFPPYGPAQSWAKIHPLYGGQVVLALGQDTLVTSGGPFQRSTDNGQTFQNVPGESYVSWMLEVPQGLPFAGTLIGAHYGNFAAYSRDRGASWQQGSMPGVDPTQGNGAENIAVVRRGPHAGRIVGAGSWGLATSDDGGATFTPVAGLWEYFRFYGGAIGVLDRGAPDGRDRLVATLIDPQRPGRVCFVKVSDDGGDTWRETFTITGDPNGAASAVVDLGGGRAVFVMNGGHIWQTMDAGETWDIVGIVPGALVDPAGSPTYGRVYWGVRGPDGRLYVGGSRLGGVNPGWMFRTVAPVVADEATPSAAPERVGVAVRPNPAGGRVEVVLRAAEAGNARVVVVDALGREVAVVLAGAVSAGETIRALDTAALPRGVYVVRASVGGQTATARLVVAR